jgi:hypothetical protein
MPRVTARGLSIWAAARRDPGFAAGAVARARRVLCLAPRWRGRAQEREQASGGDPVVPPDPEDAAGEPAGPGQFIACGSSYPEGLSRGNQVGHRGKREQVG